MNKNLSKEIKTAPGKSTYEIEKENQEELKRTKSLAADKEKYKKVMEEKRKEINRIRSEKEALEEKDSHSEQVKKLEQQIRDLETEHKEANDSYLKSIEAERAKKTLEEEIQVLEDLEDEVQEENVNEALKAIRRRKAALDWRMKLELDKSLDQDATREQREIAKNKFFSTSRSL